MNALEVIEIAQELRISLRADGEYIYYRPVEAALPEFVEALRYHKAETMALLLACVEVLERINAWAGTDPVRWRRVRSALKRGYSPNPYLIDSRDILVGWAAARLALEEAKAQLQTLERIHGPLTKRDMTTIRARQADIGFWGRLVTRLEAQVPSALALDLEADIRLKELLDKHGDGGRR